MENFEVIEGGAAASPSLFDNTLTNTNNVVSDYVEEPVMGEDNRLHATVHYKGATFDFCPSVFKDVRFVILTGMLADEDLDDDARIETTFQLFKLMFGSDYGISVMNKIADATNGEFTAQDNTDLVEFISKNAAPKN